MATDLRYRIPSAPPTHIGRYEIVRKLGVGGMARVYLALQRGPFGADKVVVIKQLRPEVADDQVFTSQFVNEARIALRLNHPNVVHTYDVVAEPGSYFMALEFLDGHSLSEIVRNVGATKIPLHENLWILTQVLAGLHYAHQVRAFDGQPLGIVHRDVSPSNVFVTYEGKVKLLDFGIAKATSVLSSTQQGIVKGKVGYAAPEQLNSDSVDARSDVYSAGVMLWEAIARRRMWAGGTYLATLQARMDHHEPASLEEICPNVSPVLAAICRRALAPSPSDRHATAFELQRDIEEYLASERSAAGVESLRAFMTTHFPHDLMTLRRDLARSVVPVTLSVREKSRPSDSEASLPKTKGATDSSARRRKHLVAVIAALLFVGLVGTGLRVAKRKDNRQAHQGAPLPTANLVGGTTASQDIVGSAASASTGKDAPRPAVEPERAVEPAAVPANQMIPVAAVRAISAPRPKRDRAVAISPHPTLRAMPAAPATAATDPIEPGMNLRVRGYARPTRSLDEKDPYSP